MLNSVRFHKITRIVCTRLTGYLQQRMEFDHDNVRLVVEEDRLSSLPDELIHKILSSFEMKFVVQTCVLSSRWKGLWTSMPCLNFYSGHFGTLPKFAKFVKDVLSHCNHQVEVSSVKLDFRGAASQAFVRRIAKYAFSHNVQQLTVVSRPKNQQELPPCLFSSASLKHFTLSTRYITPKTPWDFPALTTLHLRHITLCDKNFEKPVDLFSKCINLKNLTLERFTVKAVDIITPRLSSLMLIDGQSSEVINVIAPKLENLTIKDCDIKYMNAPPGVSSFCYTDHMLYHDLVQFSKHGFHSLNKVSVCLPMYSTYRAYKEEDAEKTINMLQTVHSAKYLTLNVDVIECLSSFPDLVSHHPSPFSNLICLTIDSSMRWDAYKVKMSTVVRNFLLENSPNATFIMDLPEKVKRAGEIDSHLKEFKALIDQGKNMAAERKRAKEKANAALENLMAATYLQVGKRAHTEIKRLKAEFNSCVEEMRALVNEEKVELKAIISKETLIRSLLENVPEQERNEVEAYFFLQLQETRGLHERLVSEILASKKIFAYKKLLSDCFSTNQDSKLALTSSSSRSILTPSTSSLNPSLNPMPGASQE